ETDVSIRPGWFYHPAEDARVRTAENLVELFFTSVGRNSKLLLNVPPTRTGLLHDVDVARLRAMRDDLDRLFDEDLAASRPAAWTPWNGHTAVAEVDLGRDVTVNVADLREDIAHGQVVARYSLTGVRADGATVPLTNGTTIGYRKLDRFEPVTVRRVRLVIEEAMDTPLPVRIALYAG